MNVVVQKEVAYLSPLGSHCILVLFLFSLLLFCYFLVMLLVLKDVVYGSEIWVVEILGWNMYSCSYTGLSLLNSEFSPANLVTVMCHFRVVLVAVTSPQFLLLIDMLMLLQLVVVVMF